MNLADADIVCLCVCVCVGHAKQCLNSSKWMTSIVSDQCFLISVPQMAVSNGCLIRCPVDNTKSLKGNRNQWKCERLNLFYFCLNAQ